MIFSPAGPSSKGSQTSHANKHAIVTNTATGFHLTIRFLVSYWTLADIGNDKRRSHHSAPVHAPAWVKVANLPLLRLADANLML